MFNAWLLIVTKELRVHMPPELYDNLDRAEMEGQRWLSTVLGWRPAAKGALVAGAPSGKGRYLLHLRAFELPDTWRSCPLWACTKWNAKTYPRLHVEVVAADRHEAHSWVSENSDVGVGALCGEWQGRVVFERGGVERYVAAKRLKSVRGI